MIYNNLISSIMTTPMITWSCITAAVVLYFMIKLIMTVHHSRRAHALIHVRRRVFTVGSEREELFAGGDPVHVDDDCDEDVI